MKVYISFIIAALFIFSGCSTKEYFTPETQGDDWDKIAFLDENIITTTGTGALLENGQILTKEGIQEYLLPEGFNYIGQSGGWFIAAKVDGTLLLHSVDGSDLKRLELKKTVAAATIQDDTLAVLFANNAMALYSVSSGALLFRESANAPVAVDSRIVNPHFLNELVLFLTLDGKIVIINSDTKQVLRSMLISSEDNFNNIIYFNLIDNIMVAATSTRLFALSESERREKYDLRDALYTDEGIWITTKEGEVIALTPSLQLKAKRKYPFAHFLGMIMTEDKIYILEKQGYMIVLSKDLSVSEVHELNLDDGYVFVGDKAFYVNDIIYPVE